MGTAVDRPKLREARSVVGLGTLVFGILPGRISARITLALAPEWIGMRQLARVETALDFEQATN